MANWSNTGEIYDPIANTWSVITPYPAQLGCPSISYVSGNSISGSPHITDIYPSTEHPWQEVTLASFKSRPIASTTKKSTGPRTGMPSIVLPNH